MKSTNRRSFIYRATGSQSAALLLAAALALAGCGRNDTKVYSVAKEESSAPPQAMSQQEMPPGHPDIGAAMSQQTMPAGHPDMATTMPQVKYQLPAGWQEGQPSAMRAASFGVAGKDGQKVDVSVIPLRPSGSDLDLVNMWRTQLQLAPAMTADKGAQSEAVAIGAEQGKLFDMTSEAPLNNSSNRTRILVAILNKDAMNWFFKMTGDEPLVQEQKPAFVEFLKSISFAAQPAPTEMAASPHAMMPSAQPSPARSDSGKPVWSVPAGWQEAPAGQFLVAKFLVAGDGGAQAAVNVSMSAGDGGGLAANVNRWRKQLGLGELSADEISKSVKSVETAGGTATVVEMNGIDAKTGQPARVVGAIVPQAGQTWFYKLMGDAKIVESQKETFTQFVQSVKY